MIAKFAKASIWVLRFFQWTFAIIILAVAADLIHQFHRFGALAPRETTVPLAFSVIALIFTSISIAGLFFLDAIMQLVSTFFDFVLWVGYLASAGLLRHNYHVRRRNNWLWQKLYLGRVDAGESPHSFRNSSLVRLLAALVIIQVILFFTTMLLQLWVAKKCHDQQRTSEKRTSQSTAGTGTGTDTGTTDAPPMSDPYNPGGVNRV